METWLVRTRWTDRSGDSFDRSHTYQASSASTARRKEIAHNRTRQPEMTKMGFRSRILSVRKAEENPISDRTLMIAGGVVLAAVVGGVVYAATRKPKASPKSPVLNQPATQLTPGHVYRFSSLAPPGSTTDQIAGAVSEIGFTNARAWSFGDTTAPADYNWPPETRSDLGVLVEGTWSGPIQNVPKGIFGLIDYAAPQS